LDSLFQAEDGIRAFHVTGVQTCALPISVPLYRDVLGLPLLYLEEVKSDGVKVAVFELGGGHLELLEPTGPESPVAKFLEKRGPRSEERRVGKAGRPGWEPAHSGGLRRYN